MQPGEVLDKLASYGAMDVQVVFIRSIAVELSPGSGGYGNPLGVKLGFSEMEGLTVKEVYEGSAAYSSGIKTGDIMLEVQGQSTRYMPINDVLRTIDSCEGSTIFLKIQRDVVLWKKL